MKENLHPINAETFTGLSVHLYPDALEFKRKNRRNTIVQDRNEPDKCTLIMKSFIDKEIAKRLPDGPISSQETFERGVLTVSVGMTTSSLQVLHLLIGEHLKKVGVKRLSLPVEIKRD